MAMKWMAADVERGPDVMQEVMNVIERLKSALVTAEKIRRKAVEAAA
jgi:hypothetical protein